MKAFVLQMQRFSYIISMYEKLINRYTYQAYAWKKERKDNRAQLISNLVDHLRLLQQSFQMATTSWKFQIKIQIAMFKLNLLMTSKST